MLFLILACFIKKGTQAKGNALPMWKRWNKKKGRSTKRHPNQYWEAQLGVCTPHFSGRIPCSWNILPGLQLLSMTASQPSLVFSALPTNLVEREDGGDIGGSWLHFPLHMGETHSCSSEEQSKQPTVFQHISRLETKNCRGHWKNQTMTQ